MPGSFRVRNVTVVRWFGPIVASAAVLGTPGRQTIYGNVVFDGSFAMTPLSLSQKAPKIVDLLVPRWMEELPAR